MPFCSVPDCQSNKSIRNPNITYFKVPSDENLRIQWEEAIPGGKHLSGNQRVCSWHFVDDIIKEYIARDNAGNMIARVSK